MSYSKDDPNNIEIEITSISADEYNSAIEKDKQRKQNQEKCERLIGEILDVSDSKIRRKRLRNLKADIQGAQRINAVESSWADYTIESIRDEIKKASQQIYRGTSNEDNSSNRGNHMQDKVIVPEDDFWNAAQKLYQDNEDRCISSRDEKYPSEWMKKKLTGKTSDMEFYGYEREDKEKEDPIKLKSKKIRGLLGDNPDKWRYKM